ncbi:MAG: FAD-dependent oxidoreductase [Candidatus Omnitrophota bacterium]
MENKIVIIGGGFAGLNAVRALRRLDQHLPITVIDHREHAHFLPLLPDVIGRGIKPETLLMSHRYLAEKLKVQFIYDKVTSIDFEKKSASLGAGTVSYDYLMVTSGAETNFYSQKSVEPYCCCLETVQDARKIKEAAQKDEVETIVIVGGGYTGIEIATNLRRLLQQKQLFKRIVIIERASSILGPLPQWMKDYAKRNLLQLNIQVKLETTLQDAKEGKITLSNHEIIDRSLLIWVAGVKTGSFIQNLNAEKNPQGRIKVDKYLRCSEHCFVAGDAACVSHLDSPVRMAVQFSIMEGIVAANNIFRSIKKKPLREYQPVDLGYVIPMANNRSCGWVLGLNLRGLLPTILHYVMCFYRLYGLRNRFYLVKDLVRGLAKKP